MQDELRVEATIENVRRISEFILDTGQRLRLTEDTLFDSIVPLFATVGWIACFTAASIWRFQREEF